MRLKISSVLTIREVSIRKEKQININRRHHAVSWLSFISEGWRFGYVVYLEISKSLYWDDVKKETNKNNILKFAQKQTPWEIRTCIQINEKGRKEKREINWKALKHCGVPGCGFCPLFWRSVLKAGWYLPKYLHDNWGC